MQIFEIAKAEKGKDGQKKMGIGKILQANNVSAKRELKVIDINREKNTVTRQYEISYGDLVWFQVSEEIRLDFLYACKDN